MTQPHRHQKHMQAALDLARQAAAIGEVPVGAIIVDEKNRLVGEGYNRREIDADPSAHAEILALRQAATHRGSWRLDGCRLYVTLEPCPMCAGALVNARIAQLVYGAADPKAGAVRSLYAICDDPRLNHRLEVVRGILADECAKVLTDFFDTLRASS
jgi:tRNA(adenine34) deaminase